MEEIISEYRNLLDLLAEENQQAGCCLQGELLETYRNVLSIEREKIEHYLKLVQQIC